MSDTNPITQYAERFNRNPEDNAALEYFTHHSLEELQELAQLVADDCDLEYWGIDEDEWEAAVDAALEAKLNDQAQNPDTSPQQGPWLSSN